jgi:hypothetical protein
MLNPRNKGYKFKVTDGYPGVVSKPADGVELDVWTCGPGARNLVTSVPS